MCICAENDSEVRNFMAGSGRERAIIRTSIIGIIANVILAAFKAAVGLLSNSISIVLDAVNNLSDALSSIITVVGTKLAIKPADKEHPHGHGRYEYLSAAVISVIILYAGFTALTESIKKIFEPMEPDYSVWSIVIVCAAIVTKIFLGLYFKSRGKKLNSDSLKNSGQDALLDVVISVSTLVTAIVFIIFGISLEAYLGVIISLIIIKSGVDMTRETISKLLGERVESELSHTVKKLICETEGVMGAYDLIMNSYGPDRWLASVHIEVPDVWTAEKIDTVSREIFEHVYSETGVVLTAIGIYAMNTSDNEVGRIRTLVTEAVMAEEYVIQIHGFHCDVESKRMRFDIVTDFASPDQQAAYDSAVRKVRELFPDYDISVQHDLDVSD